MKSVYRHVGSLVLLLLPLASSAEVLYENGRISNHAAIAINNPASHQQVSNEFLLSHTSRVSTITIGMWYTQGLTQQLTWGISSSPFNSDRSGETSVLKTEYVYPSLDGSSSVGFGTFSTDIVLKPGKYWLTLFDSSGGVASFGGKLLWSYSSGHSNALFKNDFLSGSVASQYFAIVGEVLDRPVPEPTSSALFAISALGLLISRRQNWQIR